MNKGLSGSSIELIGENLIRKKSNDARLEKQCFKQIDFFKKRDFQNIETPKVHYFNWNHDRTEFSFDMEYIPASSFKEYFLSANKTDLDNFYESITYYINSNIEIYNDTHIQFFDEVIYEKLKLLLTDSEHKSFIQYLIDNLKDVKLPQTFCHGDLTLSNILFKNGKYYLIDFLDSHIDTFYYDLSKLKQDLFYKWSLQIENITDLKVEQCIDYLWKKLYNEYQTIFDSREFQIIDALTLIRIEPYAKDEEVKIILNKCIKELKLYEEFDSANRRQV